MKTIFEEKTSCNESVKKGIYQEKDGSFLWVTLSRSGNCKTLKTAKRKIGIK